MTIKTVKITNDALIVELSDGRTISVPLAWYPRLLHANKSERERWEFIGAHEGIHWPELDEDISLENLLLGKTSGESQTSLKRWLDSRSNKSTVRTKHQPHFKQR